MSNIQIITSLILLKIMEEIWKESCKGDMRRGGW